MQETVVGGGPDMLVDCNLLALALKKTNVFLTLRGCGHRDGQERI